MLSHCQMVCGSLKCLSMRIDIAGTRRRVILGSIICTRVQWGFSTSSQHICKQMRKAQM